ncbi:MAG TPA: high-affinity branched-chain amino acid ABC transporter permease LivM [Bryobacterales bacterium]|nr:high-affinity branched-chain amino acid ABC transporter permease LivM [Bryobacterales bacterium]
MSDTVTAATGHAAPPDRAGNRLAEALREAFLVSLLAFALTSLVLGVRTVDTPTGLALEYRPWLVVTVMAIVFVGRLLLRLFWWRRDAAAPAALEHVSAGLSRITAPLGRFVGPLFVGFAFVLPFLPFADRQVMDIGILVLTYVLLAWGLNVVVGLAGLLDLGYVAFYAVGAYSYALLATHFGWSFWAVLPLAGLLAAMWGMILGFPVLRLRGDYLAIVTLAFGEIIRVILLNWYTVTKGPDGISGIPRPSFFGIAEFKRYGEHTFHQLFGIDYSSMHRIVFLYYIILVLAMITSFVTSRLRRLPVGRAWEAMREDEIACRALGINTTNTKLTAFAIGAFFGGLGGSFFATRQGFISPESFTFIESAIILAIVVLGGMGSQLGVALAAVVMIGGFEALRNMDWLKAFVENNLGVENFDPNEYRMLIFGLLMVVIMVWKPRGLIGTRMPTIFLGGRRKAISGDLVKEGEG